MFKRLNIVLGAILLIAPLFGGEDWTPQPIGPFGTLNNRDNSYALSSDKAQDLLNVDITPGGKSVKKRKGYGLAFALSLTTSPVHGTYDFFDSNGNEVSLFFNDTRMTSSISGAGANVIFSTGPNGATYQCTDSLGFAYCANTSHTTLTKTNGATYSNIQNVSSTGTMVATAVTRLAMAGFLDRPSGIDFSADSDFSTWGTGSLGTSAVQLTVNAPGAKITHITYAFGRLMWFKDTSFGYVLIGNQPFQSDWVIKTVSYDVGTNDNTSVYREGILYFRGKDGHIYAFDGSNYQRLTREIGATIFNTQNRMSNFWTQTTADDFSAGSSTNIDSTTVLGQLSLSLSAETTHAQQYSGADSTAYGQTKGLGADAPYYISSQILSTDTFVLTSVTLRLQVVNSPGLFTLNVLSDNGGVPGTVMVSSVNFSTAGITSISNANIPLPPIGLIAGTSYWLQLKPNTDKLGANQVLWFLDSGAGITYLSTGSVSGRAKIQLLGKKYVSSGTFLSAVKNAANLTTWDSFTATKLDNDGSNVFSIRSSTNPITVTSSTPTWTSISVGATPSISTGTYFQIRDAMTTSLSTTTPILSDFTQFWFEGNAADKAYATYFEDKILWSVTSGTTASTNNRILIYDVLNQGWLLYDLGSNGFYVRQNRLYFGSSASGNIYKYGDIDNDNGSPINAYWKSKDFFGGNPFTTQEIANISVASSQVANSSITITCMLNGNTSTSFVMPLYSANNMFLNKNKNLPGGTIGGTYNIKFGNNAADQPFEVFGIQVGVRPKSWIPN